MKKRLFVVLVGIFLLSVKGYARSPKVSGNFEKGSRYALPYETYASPLPWTEFTENYEEETWAYNYSKGYLQLAQKVNDRFRYTTRFNWNQKDFPYATLNNRNMLRYYRTYCWIGFTDDLNLRMEYYLREQDYKYRSWDNLTHVPNIRLRWDIDRERKRRANIYVRYNSQRYADEEETWKDKDQLSARVNYREEVFEKLLLKAQYSYTFRHYTDNPDESNAVKRAVSTGFEYQF